MDYNLSGFIIIAGVVVIASFVIKARLGLSVPQHLFVLAIAGRILGSLARYEILQRSYGGIGDALGYYGAGLRFAERFWRHDFTVFGYQQWFGNDHWWGTQFLKNLSGIILTVIGPTMRGEFLVFSLLAFAGLYCIARAARQAAPSQYSQDVAWWIWLWPSLWFWPSSVGKEAIIIFSIGLVTLGYVGREQRIQWGTFLAGLTLAFAIRPHVAAVLIMAVVIAHWVESWKQFNVRRLLEGALITIVALITLQKMATHFGLVSPDLEGLAEFMSYRASKTLQGGSSIGTVPTGIAGIPLAFMNIWMRPFPWEAHSVMALGSALEVCILWWFVWRHRRRVVGAVKSWHHHRLLRFAIPLLIGYTLMIGFTFGNLGIIARQRVPLFPFFFLLLSFADRDPNAEVANPEKIPLADDLSPRHSRSISSHHD